jgi:hypothetical protein
MRFITFDRELINVSNIGMITRRTDKDKNEINGFMIILSFVHPIVSYRVDKNGSEIPMKFDYLTEWFDSDELDKFDTRDQELRDILSTL